MRITALHIYPIKGMGGISLSTCKLEEKGFEHDRRWMLITPDGTFISQRTHEALVHCKLSIDEKVLTVNFRGSELQIPINAISEEILEVSVFEFTMKAQVVGKKYDDWFSEKIGTAVRLVKATEVMNRRKELKKGPAETAVSFADGYPYLIAGTASLAQLNSKLDEPILMNRFRANIIVETTTPHEEDSWDIVNIGAQKMQVIKSCARCEVVTINQESGQRGKEPLKTLATYRKVEQKVIFGANAIALSQGNISVGDHIQID